MSQSTEFIDIKRRNAKERPPVERVNDWGEYQQPFTEKKLKQQASRCMDCGTPFCQMGTILSTGTSGCPYIILFLNGICSFIKENGMRPFNA